MGIFPEPGAYSYFCYAKYGILTEISDFSFTKGREIFRFSVSPLSTDNLAISHNLHTKSRRQRPAAFLNIISFSM